MRHFYICFLFLVLFLGFSFNRVSAEKPWDHGPLKVSDNHRFLCHSDGEPFFWLGDTGWLLPERLDRDEAAYYLKRTAQDGFKIVQIQVINDVTAFNTYGAKSHPHGWDLSKIDSIPEYGYWDHLDYIVDQAEKEGIYIGMVCIWGGLVKAGLMNVEQAETYGRFLANRYGDRPNIIWIIGGDIQGDVKPEVWEKLATTIRKNDPNHLMTFHPRGRTTSARWFNDRPWLDFNMFQSGHRRYGQRMGNKEYPIPDGTEEDSWMYVDSATNNLPLKPVLDGEPSYEDIPQGLHSPTEPRWTDKDVRRYAYWSVFAGSCGHTYGHNAIMQFLRPGIEGAYFADGDSKPWWKALDDPGRRQMKHLKQLMLTFPYFERVPDSLIVRNNGIRYDRLLATRGTDYLLVYNHTGRDMELDLTRISGKEKSLWWFNPSNGDLHYIGQQPDGVLYLKSPAPKGEDFVLIATDSSSSYLSPFVTSLPNTSYSSGIKDLTE
ncbi:MAG: glycoside hydrolase family 140 protein [Muribaculaceae bacterium]|nr:glycoside hydrolase family 140 protein [Muribaculaceae bacterium]